MNIILKNKKILFTILAIVILVMSVVGIVFAIDNTEANEGRQANLTITEYEHSDAERLVGAEFTMYHISDTIDNVEEAQKYIKNKDIKTYVKEVPNTGRVTFSDLDLGKYLVMETKAPEGATKIAESFLINLPASDSSENSSNYDVVVYPKIVDVSGNVKVTQLDQNGNKVIAFTWAIEKFENNKWVRYLDGLYDSKGNNIIKIDNLEIGKYRLYPTKIEAWCLFDASKSFIFDVDANHLNHEFEYVAEKIFLDKQILLSSGKYGKNVGSDLSQRNTWKASVDVPTFIERFDCYNIKEELDKGLVLDKTSIHVYGINEEGNKTEIVDNPYTLNEEAGSITIKLNINRIKGFKKIEITYDTTFDDNVKSGNFSNCTTLQCNKGIDENGNKGEQIYFRPMTSAKVHVGSLLVKKVDEANNPLEGAKFKIATSKENAENGIFVKDRNNNEMLAISDEKGYVIFDGLKYGKDDKVAIEANSTYWLLETEAPTYEENGQKKRYEILKDPIEVNVNSTSGEDTDETAIVVNKKSFVLPLTGKSFPIILVILGTILVLSSIIILKRKNNFQNNSDVERQ